jgi:hypothetical protein
MAARPEIEAALKAVATALTASIKAALAEINLDDTALQKSIESEVSNGDTVTAYMVEYGRYVISGRRKFAKKVPIAALLTWIAKKGILGRDNSVRFISRNSLAFAIQNAIYKNGIQGRDFITPAVSEDFLEIAEELILDALEKEMEGALETV